LSLLSTAIVPGTITEESCTELRRVTSDEVAMALPGAA
jgi:hypothetical protein